MGWRWGYWSHRADMFETTEAGTVHYPYWEFLPECKWVDALVLSNVEYGTVSKQRETILSSYSTGDGGETTIDVSREDRALIAAAPDLLKACQSLMQGWLDSKGEAYGEDIRKIEAAIAKATGATP